MDEQILSLKKISKRFFGVNALNEVSLTINKGEVWCLVGENGSGKSTLIKVIAGVYTPEEGQVFINGKEYKNLKPIDSIREGIQIIYQDFSLFPNLTVAENIALNHQLSNNKNLVDWKEVRSIAKEALSKIDVEIDLDALVENLSVSEKQLVAISRALLQDAKLIIMDEPTAALTQREVKSLLEVIEKLREKGIAIIFVSHKLDEVMEISEKIVILRNGHKVAEGDVSEFNREKLIYHMTGRHIDESSYVYDKKSEKSLLKVDKLSKKGKFKGVSFELFPGEILGITGLLGSGRTELAQALFGIKPADSGSIYIDGKLESIKSVEDAVKNNIAYVPEDRLTEGLFLTQSIRNNIAVGTVNQMINKYNMVDYDKLDHQAEQWVEDLSIATPSTQIPVRNLSGGNQQRVVLAKWLSRAPRILILNGPTIGVDIGSKKEIHDIIKKLAKEGMGVLMITDDIPELLQTCNRILVMKKGAIVEELLGNAITEKEVVQKLSEE